MRRLPAAAAALALVLLAACDPVLGTGSGHVPDAHRFLTVDAGARSAVLTLIGGYPATDFQFNFNGYRNGELVVTIPVGWTLDVQCENRGTVPKSCAIVSSGSATAPVQPGWSTPAPQQGLPPGGSASFEVVPDAPGHYRIASLVPGQEPAGMWARLEIVASGSPSITGVSGGG